MAEAIALLGVAAAAFQFADIAGKLSFLGSSLCTKLHGAPARVEAWLEQVNLTISMAESIGKISQELSSHSIPPQLEASLSTVISSASWIEIVLKDCTSSAESLQEVLKAMLHEVDDGRKQRVWKRILTVEREAKIVELLDEIERKKSMMNIWLGHSSLQHLKGLHKELDGLQEGINRTDNGITQVAQVLQRDCTPLSEKVETSTKVIISSIDSANISTTMSLRSLEKQMEHCLRSSEQSRLATESQLLDVTREFKSMKVSYAKLRRFQARAAYYPSFLKEELDKLNKSVLKKGKITRAPMEISKITQGPSYYEECSCSFTCWSGSRVLGQHTKLAFRYCKRHMQDCRSSQIATSSYDVTIHHRIKINLLKSIFNFSFAATRGSGGISIGVVVRGYTMVEKSPLKSFFKDLYLRLRYRERKKPCSQMELERYEIYLVKVAYRVLRHEFESGTASPNDVDSSGQNLIHWQIHWRYKNARICAMLIRLLLSMGVRPDVSDNQFRTPQQLAVSGMLIRGDNSYLNHEILEWNTTQLSRRNVNAIDMLDCARRWPESKEDWGCPLLIDIMLRKSLPDLKYFVSRDMKPVEVIPGRLTPLHLAAAANWPLGVELLVAHGFDKFSKDAEGRFPIYYAVAIRCAEAVKILLRDCTPYYNLNNSRLKYVSWIKTNSTIKTDVWRDLSIVYVPIFPDYWESRWSTFIVTWETPYGLKIAQLAEELNLLGLCDLEQLGDSGRTPLIKACFEPSISYARFLLESGADASETENHSGLAAGHFFGWSLRFSRSSKNLSNEDSEALRIILQAAFDVSEQVNSRCRCSPLGFTPVAAFQQLGRPIYKRGAIHDMMQCLQWSTATVEQEVRLFALREVFTRLGMTHTCIRFCRRTNMILHPPSEENRLDIEEEESDFNEQLENFMEYYDSWRNQFDGGPLEFLDAFIDDLYFDFDHQCRRARHNLRSAQDPTGPGTIYNSMHYNFRREEVLCCHKESVGEENVLTMLFKDDPYP